MALERVALEAQMSVEAIEIMKALVTALGMTVDRQVEIAVHVYLCSLLRNECPFGITQETKDAINRYVDLSLDEDCEKLAPGLDRLNVAVDKVVKDVLRSQSIAQDDDV